MSLTPEEYERYEARKARMRAVLAANPPQEPGEDCAEGFRQELDHLRPYRMRANALLLGDDDQYTPMRWWNVIRQVRAHATAWRHHGPFWWTCKDCRWIKREN